ncbi:type II secretion system F family protein [Virgibacillus halodenitrificans]|uniref:type II secretion system F family protein n=1 Tax=Virgibacillus halodenitrificans TaxID=1482 RepID=UPI001FB50B36|nr:type II secretion system F family protein [Virgibacillus halodenitrificans]MCJ0930875.1 type II secretion system F family protein [Virgibacillus halodenitrificans]
MAIFLRKIIRCFKKKDKLAPALQLNFIRRLHRLLLNGYTLLDGLKIIKWDTQLSTAADNISLSLQNGCTIDEAFEKAHFHPIVVDYMSFVKSNGDLEGSIGKCVDMFSDRLKYTRKLSQMIRYPLILLTIFSLLLIFIKQSVLPSFIDIFQTSEEASSTVVISMITIEVFFTIAVLLLIILIIVVIFWQFTRHKFSIENRIALYSRLPFYRTILKLQTSFQFATHFQTLLKAGMNYKDILLQMKQQKKQPIIAYYSDLLIDELSRGFYISSLLSQFSFLDKQLVAIFQKNNDSLELEKELSLYAEWLSESIQTKLMKSITYFQPLFFIIVACFIIFIYIILMWPMFQLITTI